MKFKNIEVGMMVRVKASIKSLGDSTSWSSLEAIPEWVIGEVGVVIELRQQACTVRVKITSEDAPANYGDACWFDSFQLKMVK